jgi:iron complex transport system permease protein
MKQLLTKRKLFLQIILAFFALIVIMLVCSLIGTQHISLKSVFTSSETPNIINPDYEIFMHVRLPRVTLACIVGAALAGAGVIFQVLLRNPLADPYILGISSGAGLGSIIAVISGFSWTLWGRSPIAVFAFIGAIGTIWLVWFIGRLTGKSNVTGLLLAGVVVNAFFSAVIMFLISVTQSSKVFSTIFWLMGNISEEDIFVLWMGAGFIIAGIIALFYISPQLNAISFGPDDAKNMGINTSRIQLAAFAIAALITSIAVCLSGLIGFVGLIVPHGVRLVFGPDHRQLLPLSCIIGAIFLVVADTLARTIIAPAQLPVGVITAIVGGPFFLLLLIKSAHKISWFDK